MIEARGLSKRFHDKKRGQISAVENVSFTCQPGSIYGLLGANGAGKTTTLRMLATILEPTDGTALVYGHDIVEHPEKVRASVGFLSTAQPCIPASLLRKWSSIWPTQWPRRSHLEKAHRRHFARLDMNSFRDRRCDKLPPA